MEQMQGITQMALEWAPRVLVPLGILIVGWISYGWR